MPRRRANGKDRPSLSTAFGQFHVEKIERLELGTVWVDLLIPNPSNQAFRARAFDLREKIELLKDVTAANIGNFIDEEGQFTDEVIELIHGIYLHDWGGYDSAGKPCPLYDDEGEEAPCTLENFRQVVREMDGGDAFFMNIQTHIAAMNAKRLTDTGEEKKGSPKSRVPRVSARSRPTRKSRKQAPA